MYMFIEKIKAKQFEYWDLDEITRNIVIGMSKVTTLYEDCMLNYKVKICVPSIDDLIPNAHGSHYFLHPGVTKIYRDLKQTYWWSSMKKDVKFMVKYLPTSKIWALMADMFSSKDANSAMEVGKNSYTLCGWYSQDFGKIWFYLDSGW